MTISRTSSSRLDPAATPTGSAPAAPAAPATAGQAALPEAPAGLALRQQPSFSFSVEGAGALPPRAAIPEITELPRTSTPEHDRGQLLRSGERSDSSLSTSVPEARGIRMHDLLGLSSRRIASFVRGSAREPAATATPGRTLAVAPTFADRTPPPERSWRSVASAIVQGTGQVAGLALKELALTAQSMAPSMSTLSGVARAMAPVAGHVMHQAVAVGLPTFAREMLAAGVMHGLRDKPPELAMGLQAAVGTVNLAMQVIREVRERRNPDEAARAFHSLSPEAWNTRSPDEQAAMRNHAQKVSRAITVAQVASSVTNFSLMASAFSAGPENKAAALQPLATEMKVGLYTNLRDAAQASFSMVGAEGGDTHGLAGNAFAAAAATYAGALTVFQFGTSAAMDALVPGRGDAAAVLLGTSNAMSHGDAWRTTAAAAGVSAVSNTLAEAVDWFQRLHFDLSQNAAPPPQVLEPNITGQDLGRVLDQGQSRTALINGLNSALSLAGVAMTKAKVPPKLQSALGNVGLGAMVALTDSPITGNWQAQKAVRIAASVAAPVIDLEAGLRPAGAGSGARAEGSGEESGRLSGTPSGRKSNRPSFRVADVPAWPATRSGSSSPQDRSGVLSDEERRATASALSTVPTAPPGSSGG